MSQAILVTILLAGISVHSAAQKVLKIRSRLLAIHCICLLEISIVLGGHFTRFPRQTVLLHLAYHLQPLKK